MPEELPRNDSGIDAFLAAFEDGSLPKARWTHAAHLLTGACYVHALGGVDALERMRDQVRAYNLAVGGQNTASSGYHESITVFWIKLLARLRQQHPELGRAEFAGLAVREFAGRRGILREFYSFDVTASEAARREWVEPDLQAVR